MMLLTTTIGLNFTSEMMTTTLSYVSAVFSDLSPMILLIIGVSLGVMVIGAIISAVRGR